MSTNRRNLLIVGGIAAAGVGAWVVPWDRLFGDPPSFVPLDGLPPFRVLEGRGSVSAASAPFIGIGSPGEDLGARRAAAEAVKSDLCDALFNGAVPDGIVPIAYFSEFLCPHCRVLEPVLEAIVAANANRVQLVVHELPIFGAPSELAARASVAAARQGLQRPLRRRLMATPLLPDRNFIETVAAGVGIDTERLARDMASAQVQAELDRTRALADAFGLIGTPALVVGRTVVNGAVSRSVIEQIIEDEGRQPSLPC